MSINQTLYVHNMNAYKKAQVKQQLLEENKWGHKTPYSCLAVLAHKVQEIGSQGLNGIVLMDEKKKLQGFCLYCFEKRVFFITDIYAFDSYQGNIYEQVIGFFRSEEFMKPRIRVDENGANVAFHIKEEGLMKVWPEYYEQ